MGWYSACILLGVAMSVGGLFGGMYTVFVPTHIARPSIFIIFCVGDILLGAWFIASAIKTCIALYPDKIEITGVLRKRRLLRKDIGAKMFLSLGCPTYNLIPWSKRQRSLRVGVMFQPDQEFKDWMNSIP